MNISRLIIYPIIGTIFAIGCADPVGDPVEEDPQEGITTMFEGRQIDLSKDWEDATACLGWTEGGIVECYRTENELEQRESELSKSLSATDPDPTAVWPNRSNLYQDEKFNVNSPRRHPKVLHLHDRACQNLSRWGMGKQVSSMFNLASTKAVIWDRAGCNNEGLALKINSAYQNLANQGWNDRALSHSRFGP